MPQIEKKHLYPEGDQIRWLYHKYSASLLGYITGVTADEQESEKYLVTILSRFAMDNGDNVLRGETKWLQLLQYCRNLLPELCAKSGGLKTANKDVRSQRSPDSALSELDDREREVFCAIYYHGKSVGDLAKCLGESENVIRSQFKLSFDKIRSAGGN